MQDNARATAGIAPNAVGHNNDKWSPSSGTLRSVRLTRDQTNNVEALLSPAGNGTLYRGDDAPVCIPCTFSSSMRAAVIVSRLRVSAVLCDGDRVVCNAHILDNSTIEKTFVFEHNRAQYDMVVTYAKDVDFG